MGDNIATIDTEGMKTIGSNIETTINSIKNNISSIAEAVENAKALKEKAMSYNGVLLDAPKTYWNEPTDKENVFTSHCKVPKAHISGGVSNAYSEINSTKEEISGKVDQINTLVTSELQESIARIKHGLEEIETALAHDAYYDELENDPEAHRKRLEELKEKEEEEKEKNDEDSSDDENGEDDKTPTPTPTVQNSPGGGGYFPQPQYKEKTEDKKEENKEKTTDSIRKGTISFADELKSEDKTNKTTNNTQKAIEPEKTTPTNSNASTTTTTVTRTITTEPTTVTNSNNPTPSAVASHDNNTNNSNGVSHSSNYIDSEEVAIDGQEESIESLGEDIETAKEMVNSIVNNADRVIPDIKAGEKIKSGSALIPGAAGLGAAAAAGLGSKALLDKNDDDSDFKDIESKEYEAADDSTSNNKNDNKKWLYGMGVGLNTLDIDNEDYEIADDREEEQTLDDY